MKLPRILTSTFLLGLLLAPGARADSIWQEYDSDPNSYGFWNYAPWWSGGIPNSGTHAIINNGGQASVYIGHTGYYNRLDIGTTSGGSGTLLIYQGQLTGGIASLGEGSGGSGSVVVYDGMWINSSSLLVGNRGNGTLTIRNGGAVSNANASIGTLVGGVGVATVTGAGSQWTNGVDLYVGEDGNGTLNVQSGGKVTNRIGWIGTNGGSTGTATVTGVGSQWNNSSLLRVGLYGNGTLNIQSGGTVSDAGSYIGNQGGTGTATVTGAGSQWIHSGALSVGSAGQGTLNVQNGGTVSSVVGIIGEVSGSTGTATVTGAGSQWNNTSTLYVAEAGNGTLNVQSGGLVTNGDGSVGNSAGSTGVATVTGAGSQWNSSARLFIGGAGTGTVTVDAGGKVAASSYVVLANVTSGRGTLNLNGTAGSRGVLETGYIAEGTGTGGGTLNFNGGILRATGNQADFLQNFETGDVQIQSGGAFVDTQGFSVGIATALQGTTYGNFSKLGTGRLTLTGVSTYNGGTIVESGTLQISSGGALAGYFGFIAQNSGPATATVTGAGSQWNIAGTMCVGFGGDGTLNIQNGGTVNSDSAFLGYYTGTTGTVTVDGLGSQWTVNSDLRVGYGGNGTFNIQSGGIVSSRDGFIGFGGIGVATVSGAGSQWNIGRNLYVVGGNPALNIQSGGVVSSYDAFISADSGSTGVATVSGTGSQWNLGRNLDVGSNGTLNVQSGGMVNSASGSVGGFSGRIGVATVSGTGSQWIMSGSLTVGGSNFGLGLNGTLNIQAGGTVSSALGIIGDDSASVGVVTVSGTGSQLINRWALIVGNSGNGTLNVQAGGVVNSNGIPGIQGSDATSYIGYGSGTGVATISGAGSQWNIGSDLVVGFQGNGTLNVQSGGEVSSVNGTLGVLSGGIGIATVSGNGSQWTTTDSLAVGGNGNGTLNVQSGGKVNSRVGYIGIGVATVSGNGSQWSSGQVLFIGASGNVNDFGESGNGTLTVDAGGRVTADLVIMANRVSMTGTVNLNGTSGSRGVLETGYVSKGSGVGHINFSGGILRATTDQANFLPGFSAGDVQIQSGGAFIDTQSFNVGIATAMQGSGGLTKQGTGTLTLTGASTYTGATTVEAGTVALGVGGSIANSSRINVQTGATLLSIAALNLGAGQTLSGGGTVIGDVVVNGMLSPGNSPGTLTTGSQTWNGGGSYLWEINALAANGGAQGTNPGWDFADINGTLTIGAGPGNRFTIQVDSLGLLSSWDYHQNYAFTIAHASGGILGFDAADFLVDTSSFADLHSLGLGHFSVEQNGNDIVLEFAATPTGVPEPSCAVVGLVLGVIALAGRRRPRGHVQSA
jgi:T5SS/PEP-CTERM-associated repeat protein/autotransporter-associated beta strand protein